MNPPMNKSGNYLKRQYEYLGSLFAEFPDALANTVISAPLGDMEERVDSALLWRRCLLRGRLPQVSDLFWPPSPLCEKLLADLGDLDIARFCKGQEELTDKLLEDIFALVENFSDRRRRGYVRVLRELERDALNKKRIEQEKIREIQEANKKTAHALRATKGAKEGAAGEGGVGESDDVSSGKEKIKSVVLSDEEKRELQAAASKKSEQEVSAAVLFEFLREWKDSVDAWKELAEVFGNLGDLLRVRGRDLSRGILRSQGWLEVAKLRQLIEQISDFKDVVQALGRMQMSQDDKESVSEMIFEKVRRVTEEIMQKPTPFAPHEVRGIRRSDDIYRMLPQEAAFLGHPKLKMLWHARRTEQALLTYQMQGVMPQKIVEERDMDEEKEIEGERHKLERGPIICCLDTSSSMQGTCELAAKALTLEAMRLANAEKRRCYLYAFSGPGDVVEHELKLTEEGLAEFVKFLTLSFYGGTDINDPMNRALSKMDEEGWARADILLVTDGEIGEPEEQIQEIIRRHKKEKQLRIHGVLVGNPSNSVMDELCTHLHKFSDWLHLIGDREHF